MGSYDLSIIDTVVTKLKVSSNIKVLSPVVYKSFFDVWESTYKEFALLTDETNSNLPPYVTKLLTSANQRKVLAFFKDFEELDKNKEDNMRLIALNMMSLCIFYWKITEVFLICKNRKFQESGINNFYLKKCTRVLDMMDAGIDSLKSKQVSDQDLNYVELGFRRLVSTEVNA